MGFFFQGDFPGERGINMKGARFSIFLTMVFLITILSGPATATVNHEIDTTDLQPNGSSVQIPFIENQGQVHEDVAFYARTFRGTLFVTKEGMIALTLPSKKGEKQVSTVLREIPVKRLKNAPLGLDPSPTGVSSFIGDDPSKWQANLRTFNEITLGEIYEGIELRLKAFGNSVEKVFTIKAGADPDNIRLQINGSKTLRILEDGQLQVLTTNGPVNYSAPIAWQMIDGERKPVEVAYLVSKNTYGFALGDYDPSNELIIDPILRATYLGGSADDPAWSIAFDSSGNVFVAGRTYSTDFPGVDTSSAQTSKLGFQDVYVAKFNRGLNFLYHATYLGGTGSEEPGTGDGGGPSIAVHSTTGNVYVTGWTSSSNFPMVANGWQNTKDSGMDAYITVLENSLDSIIRSTYFGGNGDDIATALATHPTTGDVCITGRTRSTDLPGVSGGAQEIHRGGTWDGFAACFSSDLTPLRQATYIGGTGEDWPFGITVYDKSGEAYYGSVYITGDTGSTSFPNATVNTVDLGGGTDAFVTYLPSNLSQIVWAHRIGGTGGDRGFSVKVHPLTGDVYVSGDTSSTDFPGTDSFASQPDLGGASDGFISNMSGGLSVQRKATYFGGTNSETGGTLAINPTTGNVYLVGNTMSTDLPGTTGGAQTTNAGDMDIYAAMHSASLFTLHQATYVGGSSRDMGYAVDIPSPSNDVFITGLTWSKNFPGVNSTFSAQSSHGGGNQDGYVVRLDSSLGASHDPDIFVSPLSLNFGTIAMGDTLAKPIYIENMGAGALTIDLIQLEYGTNFSGDITMDDLTVPACDTYAVSTVLVLPGGEDCVIHVIFEPSTETSYADTLTIGSNDPDEEYIDVFLEGVGGTGPDISVTPPIHDFGVLFVDDTSSRIFTISNIGAADLTVEYINLSNKVDFSWDVVDCSSTLPFVLHVGASCAIVVTFAPADYGAILGSLQIQSNDPDSGGLKSIALSGGTDDPDIYFVPETLLRFDQYLTPLNTFTKTLTIGNRGGTVLFVNEFRIVPAPTGTPSTGFSIETTGEPDECPDTIFSIGPGANCTLYVSLTVGEERNIYYSADLETDSNDPDQPTANIDLTGATVSEPLDGGCGCMMSSTDLKQKMDYYPIILLVIFTFGLLVWRRRRLG
jgi:hypothetical protein